MGVDFDDFDSTFGIALYIFTAFLYGIFYAPTIIDPATTADLEYMIFIVIFSLIWPLILLFSLMSGAMMFMGIILANRPPDLATLTLVISQAILLVLSFIIVLAFFILIAFPFFAFSFFTGRIAARKARIEKLRSLKPSISMSIDDVAIKSFRHEVVISLDLTNSGSVDTDCQLSIDGKGLSEASRKKFTLRTGTERISLPVKILYPGVHALKASLTASNKNNPSIHVSESRDFILTVDPLEVFLDAGKGAITKNQSILVFVEIKTAAPGTINAIKLLHDSNAVSIVKSPDFPVHFEKGEEMSLPYEIKGIYIGKSVIGPVILVIKDYPREIRSSPGEILVKPPVPIIKANLQGRKRVSLGDRLDLHLELENLAQGEAINFQFDTSSWEKAGLKPLHTPALEQLDPGDRAIIDLLVQVLKSGTISITLPIVFQDEGGRKHRLNPPPLTITVEKTKPVLGIRIGAPPVVMISKEFTVDVHIVNSGQGHASDVSLSWKSPGEVKMTKKVLKVGLMNPGENRSVPVNFYSLKAGSWSLRALLDYKDLEGFEYNQESEPLAITSQDIPVEERKPVFTRISIPGAESGIQQTTSQTKVSIICYYCGFIIDRGTTSCPSCHEKVLTCEICKRPIIFDDDVGACIYCDRRFHQSHLREWIKNNGTCPACKYDLKDDEIFVIDKSGKHN